MPTLLNVPFSEKNDAKTMGARWDGEVHKSWYIPDGMDPAPFARWMPTGLKAAISKPLQTESSGARPSEAKPGNPEEPLKLSAFLASIAATVRQHYRESVWLQVELSKINNRGQHCYLDLVEYDDNGRELAKARASIWSNQKGALFRKFEQATGSGLADGMKLLIRMRPEFSPQYGMSFIVDDIDPTYTLGDMQAKVKNIREDLMKEGLYDRNRKLEGPFDFLRVAVVSPENAAGLADFMREADILEAHGLCHFDYETAVFQGKQAAESMLQAMQTLRKKHEKTPYDALVVIRGGGAAADLAWLNEYVLAKAICEMPLPVFTGIGHQVDDTILDEVAFRRFDTPSKVSAFIAGTIVNNAEMAGRYMQSVMNDANQAILLVDSRMQAMLQTVNTSAFRLVALAESRMTDMRNSIFTHAGSQLKLTEERTRAMMSEILGLSPRNTLARGYAVIRTSEGKPVSSVAQVAHGDKVEIELHDGRVAAQLV